MSKKEIRELAKLVRLYGKARYSEGEEAVHSMTRRRDPLKGDDRLSKAAKETRRLGLKVAQAWGLSEQEFDES